MSAVEKKNHNLNKEVKEAPPREDGFGVEGAMSTAGEERSSLRGEQGPKSVSGSFMEQ